MKKIIRLTESDLTGIVKRVIEEGGYQGIKNDLEYQTGIHDIGDAIMSGLTKVTASIMRLISMAKGDSSYYKKINISEKLLRKSLDTFKKLKNLKKLISLFEERGMAINKSDLGDYGFDIETLLNDLDVRYNEIEEFKNLVDDQDLINDLEDYENNLNEIVDLLYEIPD